MKKKIDKLFEIITKRVDFVNLTIKVKFFKGFEIYNNNDRIAIFIPLSCAVLSALYVLSVTDKWSGAIRVPSRSVAISLIIQPVLQNNYII